MAYGVKYRFDFYSKINNLQNRIDILEDGFVGSVITLQSMGGTPITIKWDGGDFDKDVSIIASEAVLEFVQTDDFDIDTFFSNTDLKYKVNHYVNSVLNWTGFLQTDDLQQPFLDPPNIFTVRAVDGLSFLKTVNLQDENGDGIWGLEKIMYFCQRCLVKSGHELQINNWINIFPYQFYGSGSFFSREFNPNIDPFNLASVHGQSFMTGVDQWDNCYNVLSKIMFAFGARCFQWEGEWHFVRNEDYIYYNDLLSSSTWNFDGTFPTTSIWEKDFSVEIGKTGELRQVNKSVSEGRRRPAKSTKLTYIFNQWPELIRNSRFYEGTLQVLLSTPTRAVYTLEHWTNSRISGGVVSAIASAYSGFEQSGLVITDSYLFIVKPSGSTTDKTMSTPFPVIANDRLQFSFRTSQTSGTTGAGTSPSVYLYIRTSSTAVYWLGKDGKWTAGTYNKTTEATTNAKLLGYTYTSTDNPQDWFDFSVDSEAFPATGDLYIEFWSDGIRGGAGVDEVRHKDIVITLIPFVYNSVTASGQFDLLEQSANIIDRYDETIEICNVPTPTSQGWIGGEVANVLTAFETWCHHQIDEEIPFIRIINTGVFRSLYRAYYTLDGSFVGLTWDDAGTGRQIGLINSFYVTGSNKRYIASSMEIDYKNEIVNTQLIELFEKDGTDDTADADTKQFRYLDARDTFQQPPVQKKRTFWQKLQANLDKGALPFIISLFKK